MAGLDPLSLASSGLSVLGGLSQVLFSGVKKKQQDLENYANSYQPNASIMDYYNKALSRYSANPYTSQGYQQQANQIGRNLTTGIDASQTRRGGLATIAGLVQGANDSDAKAGVTAQNQQAQELNQLGNATGMKSAEDRRKFDMIYNLKAAKAGAAAATQNQGFKNIFGGLSNAALLSTGLGKKKTNSSNSGVTDYSGGDNLIA